MKIQIELTNRCNLSCSHCIRNYWNAKPADLPLSKFKEIVDTFDADRFILYGFGESTIHKDFNEILKVARSKAEVLLVTNGLNVSRFADKIDVLAISINQFNKSIRSMLKGLKSDKLYISVILTKDNIHEFPELVKWACENEINVITTNLVPYSAEMYEKTLFVEVSRKSVEICKNLSDINKFSREVARLSPKALKLYKEVLDALGEYDLNLSYISKNWDRILMAERAESTLRKVEEIASAYDIELDLPKMFADAKNRRCPYEDCIFVRADGKFAPCMELAYTHPLYLEFERIIEERTSDNVDNEFFKKKRNLDEFFPWCGDCQFAEGCWYIDESMDCYGNKPSCSQCLYSVGIAKCLL